MKNLFLLLLSAAILTLAGCAKDGDTGPAGPAGKDGTNGTNGTDGQNGNANVQVVNYTIQSWEWTVYGTAGQAGHSIYHEHQISQINQDIIDNGLVMQYLKLTTEIATLPYTFNQNGYLALYNTYYGNGYAAVDVSTSTLQTFQFNQAINIKCVIVDGTLRAMNPDLDWSDYDQVRQRLQLQD